MIRSESRRRRPHTDSTENYWNPGQPQDASRHDSGVGSAAAIELGSMSLHRISSSTTRPRSRPIPPASTTKAPSVAPPNVSVFDFDDDDDREYLSGLKLVTVVVSVCLVMFLSLLDSSIVATA